MGEISGYDRSIPDKINSDTITLIDKNIERDDIYYTVPDEGKIKLSWNAPPDQGPLNNSQYASGIAGFKIYEKSNLEEIGTVISACSSNDQIEYEVSLSEGRHEICIAAFDNIYNIENKYQLELKKEGIELPQLKMSDSVIIIVDQSGPEMLSEPSPQINSFLEVGGSKFVTNKSWISWEEPEDLPEDSGVGVKGYRIKLLNKENGASWISGLFENTEFYFKTCWENTEFKNFVKSNTRYTVSIIGIDLLDNEGQPGKESEPFYIDKTPPTRPQPDTPFISEQPDAKILKTGSSVKVRLNPWLEDFTVNFKSSDTGTGISEYLVKDVKTLWEKRFSNSAMFLSGLSKNSYEFSITAIDKAGNQSEPETLIVQPPLLAVTFPSKPVSLVNNTYRLSWYAPINAYGIQYYKVIVKRLQGTTINYAEFESRSPITDTYYSLANVEQGVDLVAYVLAVDEDGSWSIGSKEFRLEPLNAPLPRTLEGDERWSGEWELSQPVIVPAGVTLSIESGTVVRVKGNSGIYIRVESGGAIICDGTNSPIIIKSANTDASTTDWKGIIINGGTAVLQGTEIWNAERGLVVLPGSNTTVEGGGFYQCRIGLHAGEALTVTAARFEACEWYGVKEDAIVEGRRPKLIGCVFRNNGYLYYHNDLLILNLEQINELIGNGNEEQ